MITEQIVLDGGEIAGSWTTFTNKGYDAVYTEDRTGHRGRLHHIAFATDTREDILRAADLALEQGVLHRDRPAQARHPADVLPVRLGARRQPDRAVQRRRPARARARLAAGQLDRGRARQGPGLGSEDHRDVPHPRHAAGRAHREPVRIAVLGLGEAGSEIARDLVAAGADVRGYDPLGDRRRRACGARGARPTRSATPTSC